MSGSVVTSNSQENTSVIGFHWESSYVATHIYVLLEIVAVWICGCVSWAPSSLPHRDLCGVLRCDLRLCSSALHFSAQGFPAISSLQQSCKKSRLVWEPLGGGEEVGDGGGSGGRGEWLPHSHTYSTLVCRCAPMLSPGLLNMSFSPTGCCAVQCAMWKGGRGLPPVTGLTVKIIICC